MPAGVDNNCWEKIEKKKQLSFDHACCELATGKTSYIV